MDFRGRQADSLYLQGVVGNSAATIPAIHRAVNDRRRLTSLSGQDHRIVHSITIPGIPAVHIVYRAAADGYRIICCCITFPGVSAEHHTAYRAAADGYRILFGFTFRGKPANGPSVHRAAGKLHGILLHIPGIRETADQHAGYINVSYRNGIQTHDFPAGHFHFITRHNAVDCAAA